MKRCAYSIAERARSEVSTLPGLAAPPLAFGEGYAAVLARPGRLRNSPFLPLRGKRSSNSPRRPAAARRATLAELRSSPAQMRPVRTLPSDLASTDISRVVF